MLGGRCFAPDDLDVPFWNTELICQEIANSGIGFALLPKYLIEAELKSGLLNVVFDVPLQTENSYYIALPEGRQDNVLARAFQNWLLEEVGRPAGDP